MTRKAFGFFAFVATGSGLLFSSVLKDKEAVSSLPIVLVACFFAIGIISHYKELLK